MLATCSLKEPLLQTKFSASVVSLSSYPTVLLSHVANNYMNPPPPLTTPEKFWNVFLPIAQRRDESEKLIFGPGAPGCEGEEFLVEIVLRSADGSSRRRGIDRSLEGWQTATNAACEISQLADLKSLWSKRPIEQVRLLSPALLVSHVSSSDLPRPIPHKMCRLTSTLHRNNSNLGRKYRCLTLRMVSCSRWDRQNS